jgi:hypothetical protein
MHTTAVRRRLRALCHTVIADDAGDTQAVILKNHVATLALRFSMGFVLALGGHVGHQIDDQVVLLLMT